MPAIVETSANKVYRTGNFVRKTAPVDYLIGFFGTCLGVVVLPKSLDSKTLKILIVEELDGDWFTSSGMPINSVWLPELQYCLQSAKQWIDDHPVQ